MKPGTLVWYWDGRTQRTGVVVTWGPKAVTVLPTPAGKVTIDKVPHPDICDQMDWGGGRKKLSFKGWLRLAREQRAKWGITKGAAAALRKLEALP